MNFFFRYSAFAIVLGVFLPIVPKHKFSITPPGLPAIITAPLRPQDHTILTQEMPAERSKTLWWPAAWGPILSNGSAG
jgi:hypothetical protein